MTGSITSIDGERYHATTCRIGTNLIVPTSPIQVRLAHQGTPSTGQQFWPYLDNDGRPCEP